ncbi:MBL fold metallo-hydrolase [Ideonella sp. 4Y11]|uniref:MBL fold metallo-hydrolase n=1 Tax=Ideonella aquatica TaxID=2824119 RepID=A0A941BLK4_9BURK|nr:MBL fold metallo-hydrolase [Ideonella aquatica]MBQ0959789.1 MBL fold metallo-hydrolase [Ideonella aquatica]
MIFRQLFEPLSCTYTYLLGCEQTGQALLIDPVVNAIDRDLALLQQLGLRLAWTVETHIHADHITGARHLKERVGSRIAVAALDALPCADLGLQDGVPLTLGELSLLPIHTPGHTAHHLAFAGAGRLFTGDALLIEGCGRTDFQGGSAADLYRSIHQRLFTLPDETLVYPGHDYQGRQVSSIGQEKARNPRLGQGRSAAEFEALMAALNLPYPKFIDHAVPGNRDCGRCPDDLPTQLQAYCGRMTESPQG